MAFNGSGVYNPPGSDFPAVSSTLIQSSKYNNVINDIASALSTCLTKDGQTTVTANLPMATYRHTGVGDGQSLTDYASINQILNSNFMWGGATGGSSTAYTVTLPVSPGSYSVGLMIVLSFHTANGSNPTLNVNSLGAKALTSSGTPYAPSTLPSGYTTWVYDGTNFEIVT